MLINTSTYEIMKENTAMDATRMHPSLSW